MRVATTEAILAAAEQIIVEQGMDGVCIGDIASRAGVAVGTLYNHFRDREALLGALMGQRRAELLVRVEASLEAGRGGGFEARLSALANSFFAHFDEHRELLRILLEQQGDCPAAAKAARERDPLHARVEQLMKVGLRDSALDRAQSASFYASLFMGMVKACLLELSGGARQKNGEPPAEVVTRIFLQGARGRAARKPGPRASALRRD
jgi:AcrR family transcriptional regulator